MNTIFSSILLQAGNSTSDGGASLLKFITGGGIIGYIIVVLSVVALAFVIMHFVQIRRTALIPADRVTALALVYVNHLCIKSFIWQCELK